MTKSQKTETADKADAKAKARIKMVAMGPVLHNGDRLEDGDGFTVAKKSQAAKLVKIGAASLKGKAE